MKDLIRVDKFEFVSFGSNGIAATGMSANGNEIAGDDIDVFCSNDFDSGETIIDMDLDYKFVSSLEFNRDRDKTTVKISRLLGLPQIEVSGHSFRFIDTALIPKSKLSLSKSDYIVSPIPHADAKKFMEQHHYSKGASRTSVFCHGLFRLADNRLVGAAMWMPPTKVAAQSVHDDWRRVLALSRLAVDPSVPKNGASFLIGRSIKLIKMDKKWSCLVTWADKRMGHLGGIYRATNWEYMGETRGGVSYVDKNGKQVSSKSAGNTRSKKQMISLGYICLGRFGKHKFRMKIK